LIVLRCSILAEPFISRVPSSRHFR
jgi:hypothetical protein